jgi:L-fucose isomerase-like protein
MRFRSTIRIDRSSQSDKAACSNYQHMTLNIVPFFSRVSPEGLRDEVLMKIQNDDVRFITGADEIPDDGPFFIFIGTGGTENDVADFLESTNYQGPVTLLSYDERNSLPSSMEIRAYLEKKGIHARIVHMPLEQLHDLLRRYSKYSAILAKLKTCRLGVIGKPSTWLIASNISRKEVTKRWGLKIVDIPIARLTHNLPKEDNSILDLESFQSNALCQDVSNDEVRKATSVYQRLDEIVKESRLAAVTVQCFTLLQDTGISGCLSLSSLNDQNGLVAGCEGDIPTTFTMLLSKALTGSAAFMANVASVDTDLNTAVFAHCTIPLSISDAYEITNHFETGLSVGIRGKLALEEVTVFKVFGDDLSRYWVSSGTIVDNLVNETNCRTQIRVLMDEPVEYFLEESLANHHVIIPEYDFLE